MQFFVSDLHYGLDPLGDQAVRKLARYITENSTDRDILCICGDIGSDAKTLEQALRLFDGFPGVKCGVLGNHDVWIFENLELNSWDALALGNNQLKANGFHPLEDSPITVNSTSFVGTIGWYDYSFQDSRLKVPAGSYQEKRHPESGTIIWNDARYAKWGMSDAEVTQYFAEKLRSQLASCPPGQTIIVAMHHLPTRKLLFHPRWLVPKTYRFTNAFLGSDTFSGILEPVKQISHVFCGHAHMPRKAKINGHTYACIGGDYRNKQVVTLESGRMRRVNIAP